MEKEERKKSVAPLVMNMRRECSRKFLPLPPLYLLSESSCTIGGGGKTENWPAYASLGHQLSFLGRTFFNCFRYYVSPLLSFPILFIAVAKVMPLACHQTAQHFTCFLLTHALVSNLFVLTFYFVQSLFFPFAVFSHR